MKKELIIYEDSLIYDQNVIDSYICISHNWELHHSQVTKMKVRRK